MYVVCGSIKAFKHFWRILPVVPVVRPPLGPKSGRLQGLGQLQRFEWSCRVRPPLNKGPIGPFCVIKLTTHSGPTGP
jgi:hypothetical protein